MKAVSIIIAIVTLLGAVSSHVSAAPNHYTDEMFRRAMAEANVGSGNIVLSRAPLYVLVGVKDPKSNTKADVCILSRLLTRAFAKERGLWNEPDEQRKVFQIAMSTPNRVFTFRKREARDRAMPAYTPQELGKVRRLLAGYSRDRLLREAHVDLMKSPDEQSALTKIYRHETSKGLWSSRALCVAVAHVLLEHDVLVGEDQESETLYVPEGFQ